MLSRITILEGDITYALPAISTGVYGYPMKQAVEIAIQTTAQFLSQNHSIEKVIMVCFGSRATTIFKEQYQNLVKK